MPTMLAACLSIAEAQNLLRRCLGGGTIRPGKHFREELTAEGLDFPSAWHVLRTGIIFNPPEVDVRTREWKYIVEGYEPDGRWLRIVFSFKSVESVYLITVFSVEARRRL
jgi:hypothetical protein